MFFDFSKIPSRILSRKLLNSSFGHIFSNSEYFWMFFEFSKFRNQNSVCQNFIEKAAEFNPFFTFFFQLWNILPWLESALSPVLMNKRPSKSMLKFIYSEKVTKFCEIFTLLLTVCTVVKSKVTISQNYVAFSEYVNFTQCTKNDCT